MKYTLRGKVARSHPYSLDKTLTVECTAAESKSTGEAIENVRKTLSDLFKAHSESTNNPHKVTKEQVGLGEVDNTSDENKPVSIAQAEAIKKVQDAADNAQKSADNAQKSADNAQDAADNAQKSADEAKTAADNALTESKRYSDGKHLPFTVTLTAEGWTGETAPFKQTVDLEGILETDTPHWGLVYSSEVPTAKEEKETEGEGTEGEETEPITVLEYNVSEKEAFMLVDDLDTANGNVTFTCYEEKPEIALVIQMEVNR